MNSLRYNWKSILQITKRNQPIYCNDDHSISLENELNPNRKDVKNYTDKENKNQNVGNKSNIGEHNSELIKSDSLITINNLETKICKKNSKSENQNFKSSIRRAHTWCLRRKKFEYLRNYKEFDLTDNNNIIINNNGDDKSDEQNSHHCFHFIEFNKFELGRYKRIVEKQPAVLKDLRPFNKVGELRRKIENFSWESQLIKLSEKKKFPNVSEDTHCILNNSQEFDDIEVYTFDNRITLDNIQNSNLCDLISNKENLEIIIPS